MNSDNGVFTVLRVWLTDNEKGSRNVGIFCMIISVFLIYIMTGSIILASSTYEFHIGIFGFSVTTAVLSCISSIVSFIIGLKNFYDYYDWF